MNYQTTIDYLEAAHNELDNAIAALNKKQFFDTLGQEMLCTAEAMIGLINRLEKLQEQTQQKDGYPKAS